MQTKSSLTELIKSAFREQTKDLNTSVPGHVVAFDSETQTAQLQIGIQRNGQVPAVLIECMIQFAGGNEFHIEHQIDVGDEGIIVFSQRCIDGWVNTGGVADNPILRFHDANDAYFVPGIRSQPNVITGFDNNGIKLRNKAGDQYIWLKNDDTADITVPIIFINGDIVHMGDTTQTGNVGVTGTIESTVSVTAPTMVALTSLTVNGIEMDAHTHPYTWTDPAGSGDTGGPE